MLNYKLFEFLNKAKIILKQNDIPETNPDFLKLKDLLKNNMGYIGKFTEWLVRDHELFDKLKEVFNELQNTPNLDIKWDSFDKLEKLYDYLQKFNANKKINQVLKALPSRTRELVNDELRNLILLNTEYSKPLITFYSKKGGRYKDIESLIIDTEDFIDNLKGEFNLIAYLEKIKGYNVDIIEAREDVLMIKVNDYEASCALGSKLWCISTSKEHFDNYANAFKVQFFIYDFTKKRSDIHHMIGATINPQGDIVNAHWANDDSVEDYSIFDEMG
jgi:hypothetical protein